MRVNQTQRMTAGSQSRATRRKDAGGDGFRLARRSQARKSGAARGLAPVGTLDAIVALQAVDDAGERRRKAVRQGHEILDVLDDLKIAVLSGRVSAVRLEKLKGLVEKHDDRDLEPELGELLRQIDLRARVELAKRGKSAA